MVETIDYITRIEASNHGHVCLGDLNQREEFAIDICGYCHTNLAGERYPVIEELGGCYGKNN